LGSFPFLISWETEVWNVLFHQGVLDLGFLEPKVRDFRWRVYLLARSLPPLRMSEKREEGGGGLLPSGERRKKQDRNDRVRPQVADPPQATS